MNRKILIGLTVSMIIGVSCVGLVTVSASPFSFVKAASTPKSSLLYRGTIETWIDRDLEETAKVIESSWRLIVHEDEWAMFYLKYTELNIEEEIPGTYDYFVIRMRSNDVEKTLEGCIVAGTSEWWKNGELTYSFEVVVTIDPTDLRSQFSMGLVGQGGVVWFTFPGSLLP